MVAQEQESERIRQLRRRNHPAVMAPVPVPVTKRALERLPWTVEHRAVIAGVRVLIRSTGEQDWQRLLEHVPAGRPYLSDHEPDVIYSFTPVGAPHLLEPVNQYVLYQGSARVIRDKSLDDVLKAFLSDLTSALAHLSRPFTFFHAGAVSLRDAGIVLPGRTGSGKSTLVKAFAEAGAQYYSDEVAAIDPSGKLHPFLKPLWLRPEGEYFGPKLLVPAAAIGAKNGHRIRPVRLVAFPEWGPRARLRATRVPRSSAALALFSNAFAARAYPMRTLSDATEMVKEALCVRIRYKEAHDAVPLLQALLDESLGAAPV
jgi:hypothetical protein